MGWYLGTASRCALLYNTTSVSVTSKDVFWSTKVWDKVIVEVLKS